MNTLAGNVSSSNDLFGAVVIDQKNEGAIRKVSEINDSGEDIAGIYSTISFDSGNHTIKVSGDVGVCRNNQRGISVIFIGSPVKLDPAGVDILCDADQIMEMYIKDGESFLGSMGGRFILLVLEQEGSCLIATDRSGIVPIYYHHSDGVLFFSTNLNSLVRCCNLSVDLNRQSIYDYLYFHVVPGPETIYEKVEKLLPGSVILVKRNSHEVQQYWGLEFNEQPIGDTKESGHDLLKLLSANIELSAQDSHTGAFLSGGTDSSTITGLLSKIAGIEGHAFSIGFEADGYDEMEYARIAAKHFGINHHEYYVTPQDVVDAIPAVSEFSGQPFGNASVIPAYYCARMAKDAGIDHLLAGDGGDELFGGNYRYAKQIMFDRYIRLPLMIRKFIIEPIVFGTPFIGISRYAGKIRSYIDQANIKMPDRMESYNLMGRIGPENIFTSDYLDSIDRGMPISRLTNAYCGVNTSNILNRMLAVDMRFVLYDSDIPKVNMACEMAGVDVSYPMLDARLVDFSAKLPADMKVRGTRLRYFYKKALSGFLPDKIISKPKQGFGLPFGVWLVNDRALRELAFDTLSSLKKRGIVSHSFIDELMTQKHMEHAAYYGVMIWILMMLEQWMSSRNL